MPDYYRVGQLGKASQKIGSIFQSDINDDGSEDDVQEVSYEVRDDDNENDDLIIVVDCPEDVIGCANPVVELDEGWTPVAEAGNGITEVLSTDPDYPCGGTPNDCTADSRVYRIGIGVDLSFGFADPAPAPLLVPLNSDSDTVEDDLVAIDKPLEGNVTVSISSGSSRVKLWNDSTKGSVYLSTYMPQTLYIEGLAVSQSPGDVTLQFSNGTNQHSQKVTVFNVQFGSSEIRIKNVSTTLPWQTTKSAALQWDGNRTVNLSGYLTPVSKVVRDGLNWTYAIIISHQMRLKKTETPVTLSYVGKPDENSILAYEIEAQHEQHTYLSDRFILVIYPEETATEYSNWIDNNQNFEWTRILPSVYNELAQYGLDPEPDSCNNWKSPSVLDSYYHPGASDEMRTQPLGGQNRQGHQATYDSSGSIISSGLGAGTADRTAPRIGQFLRHRNEDVRPYIWAAQLDANPVRGIDEDLRLSHPFMHKGANLKKYLELRPIQATPDIAPGACQ